MSRVLVVSNDYVGSRMAGPGIRYYHFARELAKRHEVALVAPNRVDVEIDGVEVHEAGTLPYRRFKSFSRRFDVVVAQTLSTPTMRHLARSDIRTIYDLYTPFVSENLPLYAHDRSRRGAIAYRATTLLQAVALATGDAFVCASERQRDLWLGALAALGRVTVEQYRSDPTLRELVAVVPFGLEEAPPRRSAAAVKGVVPGIADDDHVLLWGGGIWSWFDPLTPIRAIEELSRRRDDVKLYFLGAGHPNPIVPSMDMAGRALELARSLELEGRFVFFNPEWVPYEERQNYLLDADIGISSHFESIETHFAFRTRMLDYLWAGLPVVSTRGDVFADLIASSGLGRTVPEGDVSAWCDAIESVVDDEEEHARIRANVAAARARFEWPRVVEELQRLVSGTAVAPPPARASTRLMVRYVATAVTDLALERGVRGALVESVRTVRRPRVP